MENIHVDVRVERVKNQSKCMCGVAFLVNFITICVFECFFLVVSIQCLEAVYGINRNDPSQTAALKSDKPLAEIFKNATQVCTQLLQWIS